jgi:wobble nucleotide-excising tRNase
LEELKKMLEIKIEANKGKIEAKIKEPSSTITLDTIKTELDLINELITTAKKKIELHNETVKNITRESSQLTKEVWRYIVEQLKSVYQNYNAKNITFTKSIEGLEKSKKANDDKLKILKAEISELEQLNTGVEHTKNEINTLLEKFGFTNFKLTEATEEKGSYQIIRPTGERVERTLSEGEKTFITFLYFYHWLKGSIDKDLISVDRVVVFDDPISSLDCDVLFIVSHLIRKTIDEIRSKTSNIKQIIILTHNVYFHKEVTFNIKRQEANRLKDETFWVLRKKNDVSKIFLHEKNPVQTSYELLWREVKENPDSITIENSLRRIIENYFKMFGGISPDDILNRLDDEDKMTAASLLSWSNAGSHGLNDDLYIATESEKYLKVFKTIFERTKHIEHYNMMMGISPEVEEPINIE